MKKPTSVTRRHFLTMAGLVAAGISSEVHGAELTPKAKSVLSARRVVTGHDAKGFSFKPDQRRAW